MALDFSFAQRIEECLGVGHGRAQYSQGVIAAALLRVVATHLRFIRGALNRATQRPPVFLRIVPCVPWIHGLDGAWAFAAGQFPDPPAQRT